LKAVKRAAAPYHEIPVLYNTVPHGVFDRIARMLKGLVTNVEVFREEEGEGEGKR